MDQVARYDVRVDSWEPNLLAATKIVVQHTLESKWFGSFFCLFFSGFSGAALYQCRLLVRKIWDR